MRPGMLRRRGLRFHWRAHIATALCAATAGTVLTGSLLVGDSMRGSLRENALARIGPIDQAMIAARFFRHELADEIAGEAAFTRHFGTCCPLILARGSVEATDSDRACRRVSILGIDERFRSVGDADNPKDVLPGEPDAAVLNVTLADRLGVKPGDDVLIRLASQQAVSTESLFGRTDRATASLRLKVARIVPAVGAGGLSLDFTQSEALNAYVPLATLQRTLKQPGLVNALLITTGDAGASNTDAAGIPQQLLARHIQLRDLGLRLRPDRAGTGVVLESERLMLEPAMEAAAMAAAENLRIPALPVLTYLANTMTRLRSDRADSRSATTSSAPAGAAPMIPYSTVSAIPLADGTGAGAAAAASTLLRASGEPVPALRDEEILLNEWAAKELSAAPGDLIRMTFYVADAFHLLRTESADFTLRDVVRMDGLAVDRTLAPEYEGITSAQHLTDWDPPFPMDLKLIHDRDEDYWDKFGPAPKAFVAMSTGQRLWAREQSRFGRISSLRFGPVEGQDSAAIADTLGPALLAHLKPASAGMVFEPIRARLLASSRGNTDFGQLFLAFSIFLIASAALLLALTFRLGVERRCPEIGLLLAVGVPRKAVARNLVLESACPAAAGVTLGLLGAILYARLMLVGLQSWWSDAIQPQVLRLHARSGTLLVAWLISVTITVLVIAGSVRGISRIAPRALLAGKGERPRKDRTSRWPRLAGAILFGGPTMAILLIVLSLTRSIPATVAFFGSGTAILMAVLASVRVWMVRPGGLSAGGRAASSITRLGLRNAARSPLRTLVSTGLIASATFIITTVGANRREAHSHDAQTAATGGFALMAESAVPIVTDLNTEEGRWPLSISPPVGALLTESRVMPFRLRPGDDASCLSQYRPTQPRLLGAPRAMIERGGFAFRASLAASAEEKANPWLLLERRFDDGAIPAIADDNTATWLLHLGLGDDLVQRDDLGRDLRLRIVGLLSGSVLQSELIIAEPRFVEHFPTHAGYRFFLIQPPPAQAEALARGLEKDLNRYGLEVSPAGERLARYQAVENAYMSAFQTLGGLGLLLGTVGLGAVLWRNILDRRGELALLRALGYANTDLRRMIFAEHTAMLVGGLLTGAVAGLIAAAPELITGPEGKPWLSLGAMLAAVLASGMVSMAVALRLGLRTPLLAALRNE